MLVFDKDLSPAQARGISDSTALRVVDRTQLILDIFAQRAQSADGKLQVELAQLQVPPAAPDRRATPASRACRAGSAVAVPVRRSWRSIAAGCASASPSWSGRSTRSARDRAVRRGQRNRRELPVISIVGYTNAGKSTLLNAITRSEVLVEDKLFATLDPTSRRLRFPREREVIITDTVGFIRDLPKDLVAAFRATLEELDDAVAAAARGGRLRSRRGGARRGGGADPR